MIPVRLFFGAAKRAEFIQKSGKMGQPRINIKTERRMTHFRLTFGAI